MKIEKLNDNQVKIVLNRTDLDERNIRINELAYGAEKTQALFREIMEQAMQECDFEVENVPLMIEAIPFTKDSMTIIVTKVTNSDEADIFPRSREIAEDFSEALDTAEKKKEEAELSDNTFIFSFENLKEVTNASVRLYGKFNGENMLFKNLGRYFLILDKNKGNRGVSEVESILSEYGEKHMSNCYSKNYLLEHGEIIIKSSAVEVLYKYFK